MCEASPTARGAAALASAQAPQQHQLPKSNFYTTAKAWQLKQCNAHLYGIKPTISWEQIGYPGAHSPGTYAVPHAGVSSRRENVAQHRLKKKEHKAHIQAKY